MSTSGEGSKAQIDKGTNSDSDDDSLFCDICNVGFQTPKPYFSHVYSISHIQRANARGNSAPRSVNTSASQPSLPVKSTKSSSSEVGRASATTHSTISAEDSKKSSEVSSGHCSEQSNPGFKNEAASQNRPGSSKPLQSQDPVMPGTSNKQSVLMGMDTDSGPQQTSKVALESSGKPFSQATSKPNAMSQAESKPQQLNDFALQFPDAAEISSSRAAVSQPGAKIQHSNISEMTSLKMPCSGNTPQTATVRPHLGSDGGPLRPSTSVRQKVPLLRSPPPIRSLFDNSFSSSFDSSFMAIPRPATSHRAGPLLPTPLLPIQSPPPIRPTRPALLGAAPKMVWGMSSPSGDAGLDLHIPELKDYCHHVREDMASSSSVTISNRHSETVEPLIDGRWVFKSNAPDDLVRTSSCQTCNIDFNYSFHHQLHLAGLKHQKNMKISASKSASSSDPVLKSTETKDVEPVEHSAAFVTGLLKPSQSPVSVNFKDSPSTGGGGYSEMEQKLCSHPGPILGADYITEYQFLRGHSEHACDLCNLSLGSVSSVIEHVSSAEHLLQYMCYNDAESYKAAAEKASDVNFVKEIATKIEKSQTRRCLVRVKLESDEASSDGQVLWIELKNKSIQPTSALPGHRSNGQYSTIVPHKTFPIVDVDCLLRTVSMTLCVSAGRPPSLSKPLRKQDFIKAIGQFEIKSAKDAEVCLQLANCLTLAVLNYRLQMLPNLDSVDVSKIEEKLKSLHQNAEIVAQKTIASDPSEFDLYVKNKNETEGK